MGKEEELYSVLRGGAWCGRGVASEWEREVCMTAVRKGEELMELDKLRGAA